MLFFARYPKLLSWFFLAILGVLPLFFWPQTHIISEFPKALLFDAAALVLFGLFVSAWMHGRILLPSKLRTMGRWMIGGLAAFFLFTILATVFSVDHSLSFWGTYYRYFGFVHLLALAIFFCIAEALLTDKAFLERSALALSFASIPVVLFAFSQWGGIDPLFGHLDAALFFGRIFSVLGNPNYLAQYLVFLLPLSAYFCLRYHGTGRRFFGLLFFLQTGALLLTESRAGQLGFLFALAAFLLFLALKRQSKRARFGLVALFLVPVLLFGALSFTKTSIPLFSRWLPVGESAGSIQARLALWDIAGRAIADKPLLGFGPETFVHVVNTYQTEALPPYTGIPDRAHNILLDIAVSYGVLAVLAFVLVVILAVVAAFRSGKELPAALGSSVLGLFVTYQFGFMTMVDGMLFVFALAALFFLMARSTTRLSPLRSVRAQSLAELLVIAAVFVGLFFTFLLPFRADLAFQRGVAALADRRPFPAMHHFGDAIDLAPKHRVFYAFQAAHRAILYANNQAQRVERQGLLLEDAMRFADQGLLFGGAKQAFDEALAACRRTEACPR